MTCIVGIEHSGRVYLAGDIQGTGHNVKVAHTQPKVFLKNGVAFGYTSSYRFGQIIEQNLPNPVVPEKEDEVYRWLICTLVPSIKTALKSNDYDKGGICLIGVKGQLWEMQDDFSVIRAVNGYNACGSGYEYALGSMETSKLYFQTHNADEYVKALKRAIHAAGSFSPSVGTDSVVIHTPV